MAVMVGLTLMEMLVMQIPAQEAADLDGLVMV